MTRSDQSRLISAELYAKRRLLRIVGPIGAGKDGSVYKISPKAAVKIHDRRDSFDQELAIYQRLRECQAVEVVGFRIPKLLGFAEDLHAIEMSIVHPPFVVDFASAVLDRPLDFPDDTVAEWHQRIAENFGLYAADAHRIIDQLGEQFGVYLYDLYRHNIKFHGE